MMWKWIDCFTGILFPPCCTVCHGPLNRQEKFVCLKCLAAIPRTNFHGCPGNAVEQIFWGQIPVVKATSFLYYRKGSDFNAIVYKLKYGKCKEIGEFMGRVVAREIAFSGFFEGIDWIVPVPLHQKKERQRGYNQSEWFAKGISAITGIPVRTDLIFRKIDNPTQTRKSSYERWENVSGIFEATPDPELENKNILLVDDVLTTGSTLLSACQTLSDALRVKINILTLAVTLPS